MADDRISVLPDSILYHIVSFLPTRHAAATCILSKRWNQLWLSVLTLHSNDQLVFDSPPPWVRIAKFLDAELIWTYNSNIPTLHNVTQLEFIFKSESWRGRRNWVVQVLQHCPNLQDLIIDEDCNYEQVIEDEDWKEPEVVPTCLSSQLRTCNLKGFKGYQCEFEFAKFILLNSKLSHTLEVKSTCTDEDAKSQMTERSTSYYRPSTSKMSKVVINFSLRNECG